MTATSRFESSHRFKTLSLCVKTACRFDETPSSLVHQSRRIIFVAGNQACCISKSVRSAHDLKDQRGLKTGADVQIGGGVRVSDALQAIVGFEPVAIWVRWFCVEISQGEAFAFPPVKNREIRAVEPAARKRRARADVSEGGRNEWCYG